MRSSGPRPHSVMWIVSGVILVLLMRLSWMHIPQSRTQFLTYVANEGKYYFCRICCIILERPGCLPDVLCNDCNNTFSSCPD